eukprot:gnl/MRDRNA2_/MRDRNA2_99482_c0_seq1.p1 gnl/MRDRNA2_/MRDRNA2_99482_c0~~gnl/MRDRNA2_/MRDRNA2_99482_c0_seq1.p1  ORF type:complete len:135 (+),score=14.37 gnl/MRDRNA2_/MRDRNA2_99482_c0_seq1:112-516(+)
MAYGMYDRLGQLQGIRTYVKAGPDTPCQQLFFNGKCEFSTEWGIRGGSKGDYIMNKVLNRSRSQPAPGAAQALTLDERREVESRQTHMPFRKRNVHLYEPPRKRFTGQISWCCEEREKYLNDLGASSTYRSKRI